MASPTKKYSKQELEDWINSWDLTADEKQSVLSTLGNEKVVGYLGEGVLSRRESDRLYRELQDERASITTKQQEVIALEQQLIEWRDENNPKFESALAERERLQTELKQVTDAYIAKGGSLSEFGKPPVAQPPAAPAAAAFDESKYIARDEYEKAMKATVPALAQWTAQALQIDREHFELTGQHPDLDKVLAEVYKGKPARQAWEESHGIADIRAKKAEEQVLARIEAAKQEERSRVLTEQAVDPHARVDNGQVKGFLDGLVIGTDDATKVAQNDAMSRARASKALEGFNPYAQ